MIARDPAPQGPVITGFSGAGFKAGGQIFPTSLMLTPDEALPWDAPAIDALAAADIAPLLAVSPAPEFLLLGTGGAMHRPSPAFIQVLEARGIGVEVMDSRAAARAWGLLRGEGRWIVAALLPLA
jgi:uncharacterized protein